jgi:hypothetical protein
MTLYYFKKYHPYSQWNNVPVKTDFETRAVEETVELWNILHVQRWLQRDKVHQWNVHLVFWKPIPKLGTHFHAQEKSKSETKD